MLLLRIVFVILSHGGEYMRRLPHSAFRHKRLHQRNLYWFMKYNDLLNGWNLPIGGASLVEGLQSTGLPCLVFNMIILDIQKRTWASFNRVFLNFCTFCQILTYKLFLIFQFNSQVKCNKNIL